MHFLRLLGEIGWYATFVPVGVFAALWVLAGAWTIFTRVWRWIVSAFGLVVLWFVGRVAWSAGADERIQSVLVASLVSGVTLWLTLFIQKIIRSTKSRNVQTPRP